MPAVAEKCRCGLPLVWRDSRVGWYWCDHCDRAEHDPRHIPRP